MSAVDVKEKIGEIAGKVWNLLSGEGSLTVAQMKKKLEDSSDLLNFALGWLAREDKIEIIQEKRTYRVQLK